MWHGRDNYNKKTSHIVRGSDGKFKKHTTSFRTDMRDHMAIEEVLERNGFGDMNHLLEKHDYWRGLKGLGLKSIAKKYDMGYTNLSNKLRMTMRMARHPSGVYCLTIKEVLRRDK